MMSEEDFNSMACDFANDYAQARQEMGPEDFQEWDAYLEDRMSNYLQEQANAWHRKNEDRPRPEKHWDDDELPF
jgi:hypothetical protein